MIRPVKLLEIQPSQSTFVLEFPGTIAANQSVNLGFEVPGKIIELSIKEGQEFKKGDKLAKLDPTDYEAAKSSSEAELKAARANYQRMKSIFEKGAGTEADVDSSLRNLRVAEEALKQANKALEDTLLYAPFDGQVGNKIAKNFQSVQAKQAVMLFQDLSSLEMDVYVPEQDFVRRDPNSDLQQATDELKPQIQVESLSNRRFPAWIKSFEAQADVTTRTYKVTFGLERPTDVSLLPGMTGTLYLYVPNEGEVGEILIPASSILADSNKTTYVWIFDETTKAVSKREVTIENMGARGIRVTNGLQKGEVIAIRGVNHLRQGMKVRPLDNEA
ncbi:MAG: efflux RND transporter periplasmic adaptor subunit [Pseudomonadota bacterium]